MCGKIIFYKSFFFLLVLQSVPDNVIGQDVLKGSNIDEDYGKSSLVFVFDTTGSMYNDLRQLREGAEMILQTALGESNVIADFVFVPFHDPVVGPATVTKDKEVFKSALNIVRVYGGGDCPEKSLGGIQLALRVSRPRSFIYVFTDATASDHRLVGKVLENVQRKQSQVVFVLTGHCNDLHKPQYKVYQQIAAASSGQVFNLNKTSVHKVLGFVRSSIKGRSVNLASAINPPGYNYTKEIPVDQSVSEVTVSVSGSKPQIHVVNPSGEELTGPPQLVTTLDLSEIMIVKLLHPEPGNWSVTVGSEREHSVRVQALSNVTFQHGFSVSPPASMDETSYRPLRGAYNHLLISVSGSDRPLRVQHADILELNGQTKFEVRLREVGGGVYRADAFIPPEDLFYIAIRGEDDHGQEFRRVGATAVQAKSPDVPYIVAPNKMSFHPHERAVVPCHAESLVPLTVSWARRDMRPQRTVDSLQSTSLDLVIEHMSEADEDTYDCIAKNAAGVSRVTTTLELIAELPQVSISASSTALTEHEHLNISCSVVSEAFLLNARLEFHGKDKNFVTRYPIDPSTRGVYTFHTTVTDVSAMDAGQYACVAANRGGQVNQTVEIAVQNKPTAQILGPHKLSKSEHSDVQAVCRVDNAEAVQWVDADRVVRKAESIHGSYVSTLDIRNITADCVWTCVASRNNYSASDAVEVLVTTKPRVRIAGPKNITVVNGTVAELVCTVASRPPPRILWHMETERFLDNMVTQIQPNVYKSVLKLNSSKENCHATFFCVGENSEGIHQDYVNVYVRRKMKLVAGFSDLTAELYSNVRLPCTVDSYPPPNITWFHNDTVLHFGDKVNMDEDDSTLIINKLDFDNLGSYRCVAVNGFENVTVTGNLGVGRLEAPVIEEGALTYVARKGQEFSFTCRLLHGKPEPSITWEYKNSTNTTALPKGVKQNGHDIEIASVGMEHEGLYRCVAQNVLGADSRDIRLEVQYPPQEINSHSSLQEPLRVSVGGETKLSCDAQANPSPIVFWTKDSKPVIFSDRVSITEDGDLVLSNARADESGVYTCTATNPLGSLHKNFTVDVFMSPRITLRGEPELEVVEGQLVELPCAAAGAPGPAVRWMHNGGELNTQRKRIDDTGLRFIANVTDFGDYSCVATNEHGTATFNYTVLVWVAPFIKGVSREVLHVHAGSNVSLRCDAVGFPLPEVLWAFNDDILTENSTELTFNDIGNLHIREACVEHEGEYACLARNIAGEATKIFLVTINEGPKFVSADYRGPYVASTADSVLKVTCRATGRPAPYVYWIKDGYYLDKDDRYEADFHGTLTIKNPTEDLSGTYTCLAKNAAGNITRDIPVEIYPLHAQMASDSAPTTMQVLEGSNVDVTCPVGREADSVKWYKDAILISNETLKLSNVSRGNSSNYACVVSNAISSAHAEVQLDVQWPPRFITVDNLEVDVLSGDDVYLNCETDAKPPAKTKWLFNSKTLVGEDSAKLKLTNVHLVHTGLYRCVSRNEHGTIFRQFTLNVLEPPHISRADELDVLLKADVNATIECNAKGFPEPTISWIFNNTQWKVEDTKLIANNITEQAEGWFRCEATNRAGKTHVVYRVSVVTAPAITHLMLFVDGQPVIINTTVEIVIGSNARIACKAISKPSPVIQWIRHGNTMSQNTNEIGYADLMLTNVNTSHSGEYQCFASNDVGLDHEIIKVKVLEPPKIFQTFFDNTNTSDNRTNMKVLSGQAFFLPCHPYGDPIPEVYWFKDGLPLHLYDDTMTSSDFGEVILTNSARIEHSGNYTCVARNKVGENSAVYLVEVLAPPPKQKEEVITISQSYSKLLNLTCPTKGTPQPQVIWMKLPYTEITVSNRVELLDENYTLIINSSRVSDSGKYSCIATNKVGTTEVVFDVTIEKEPTIVGNTQDNVTESHQVTLGRSVVLKCDVNGNPTPKISWLKDIEPVGSAGSVEQVLNGSLLTMWAVRARHAGTFSCVAQNSAGLTQRRYHVFVRVPGKWSAWSSWSYCNATCGLGYQVRSRLCQYVDEYNNTYDITNHPEKIILDDSACKGLKNDSRKCHMPSCEEGGASGWSRWSAWSACSASCGAGSQTRVRRCRHPPCAAADNLQIRRCAKLPKCRDGDSIQTNDVYGSFEDVVNSSEYIPEAAFEMQPKSFDSYETEDDVQYYEKPIINSGSIQSLFYDVNVTQNLDGSEHGVCAAGYTRSADICVDVDECSVEHNHCHATQLCANTAGGYRCGCADGFGSLGAGQRCLDINECQQGIDGCEWACVNVAGGYVCACPPHLRLQRDRRTCRPPPTNLQAFGSDMEDGDDMNTFVVGSTRYIIGKPYLVEP